MEEMFTPTLDWGDQLWVSLAWIAKGWLYAAVATLVVLLLVGRFTTWGRQFWRISGAYFTGRDSIKVWAYLAVLLASVLINVRLDVLFTYQSNDLLTSFQVVVQGLTSGNEEVRQSGIDGFWSTILIFSILATLSGFALPALARAAMSSSALANPDMSLAFGPGRGPIASTCSRV